MIETQLQWFDNSTCSNTTAINDLSDYRYISPSFIMQVYISHHYKRPATTPKAPRTPAPRTGTAVAGLTLWEEDDEAEALIDEALALAEDDEALAAAAVLDVDALLSDLLSEWASSLEEWASLLAEVA